MSAEGSGVSADQTPRAHDREPLLRVVAGSPTPDELAVVVTVLTTRASAPEPPPQFSLWSRKSRNTRPTLRPGFGAWRASAMPR